MTNYSGKRYQPILRESSIVYFESFKDAFHWLCQEYLFGSDSNIVDAHTGHKVANTTDDGDALRKWIDEHLEEFSPL